MAAQPNTYGLKSLARMSLLLSLLAIKLSLAETLVEKSLTVEEGAAGDQFGAANAASGGVLVAAAPWANIDGRKTAGAVYVFLRDPSTQEWVQHQRLMPNDGEYDSIEMSVAISGETIVVGAYYAQITSFQEGAVYVFDRAAAGTGD